MKKFASNTKIGQVITKEDIAKFKGDVILDTPTGSGKTTFVLTNLSEYCAENNQTILFVCNRKVLAEEVKLLIKKNGVKNVDVITYQAIENKLKNNKEVKLEYDWICMDEYHHVLEVFNVYTDLSFKHLNEIPSKKIYMSATCSQLFSEYVSSGKVPSNQYYYIEKDYSYISKLSFYNKKDDFELIIEDKLNNTDDKVIFFTQSLSRAKELYLKYRDIATFFCSSYTSDSTARKYLKECKGDFKEETFRNRLLISTVAMDVGVSLKDESIKTIILDIFSWQNLIQCLGRKRIIHENDTCEVYIRNYHRGELNRFHNQQFKSLDTFINNPNEFFNTYGRERDFHSPYIFKSDDSDEWTANVVAYYSLKQYERDLYIMKNRVWEDETLTQRIGLGYKNFILNKMDIEYVDDRIKDYDNEKDSVSMIKLVEYLNNNTDKKLFKDDQKALIEEFRRDGLNSRTMGINVLNGFLKDEKLPFTIVSKRGSERINGKVKSFTYWQLIGDLDI